MSSRAAITIVCSADAGYVLPLTVMLVSLRTHVPPHRPLDIHIIDDDIPAAARTQIERSVRGAAVTVSWHTPDRSRFVGVPLWGRLPLSVYNKLLIPDVLPAHVETALWLDCDTLVLADVSTLWDAGTGDHALLAVQDPVVPQVSSDLGVARYREMGLPHDAEYFNCGVMLMNVQQWRELRVSERALEYLKTYARDVAFLEQEGINAVLARHRGPLDRRWNWSVSVGADCRQRAIDDGVAIAHFSGNLKPWRHDSGNPFCAVYYDWVDRTVFAGSRPRSRWHTTALRSYERAAFRPRLRRSEQLGLKLWRALTRRVATMDDTRITA